MKKIIVIQLLFICFNLFAETYYVKTTGNDSADGKSDVNAWLTWKKAFATAQAGDTVYFRDGIYSVTDRNDLCTATYSGTAADYICYFNYPGEVPIMDCTGSIPVNHSKVIDIRNNKNYINISGLTIRNLSSALGIYAVYGIYIENCHHINIENCNIYNIGGRGFLLANCDEIHVKNCDAHHCSNPYSTPPGNIGSGFTLQTGPSYGEDMYDAHNYFEGCRSWSNSDNGFSGNGVGYAEYKNCWSFNNGSLSGEGTGFKLGWGDNQDTINPLSRLVYNCIAADNGNYGFCPNNGGYDPYNRHIYNNFSYHNGYKYWLGGWTSAYGVGFRILDYLGSTPAPNEMHSNNISYKNEKHEIRALDDYTHEYNSWDQLVTVTDADFLSLDTAELRWARQADSSLPEIYFGKLVSSSDLIDAGVDIGLDYDGTAPDLGWYEFDTESPPAVPQVNTLEPVYTWAHGAKSGGIIIYDGDLPITAKGITWATDTLPDLTDNVISGGTGTADYISKIAGLTKNTTYHVRAYATNAEGTSYGADVPFTTDQWTYLFDGLKPVFYNGKKTYVK